MDQTPVVRTRNFKMRERRVQAAWVALLCFTLGACGPDVPDVVEVEGTVTLNGAALDRAVVKFVPAAGRQSVGVTDQEGHYRLMFTNDRMGAIPGEHRIVITSAIPPSTGDDGPPIPGRKELLPRKYNEETELSAIVDENNRTIDFNLQVK